VSETRVKREGNDLVVGDGTTFCDFYTELEADPFLAGVYRASHEPMRLSSVMEFSSLTVLIAMENHARFQEAIEDAEKWRRFQHGWSAAFALSTDFVFDQEADDERHQLVEQTLDFFGQPLTFDLLDSSRCLVRYMKEEEFTELQRGMGVFGASETWAKDLDDDFSGYTNFHSLVGTMEWLVRGLDSYAPHETDASLDGTAVVLADETARRMTSAYRLGFGAMAHEYAKDHIFAL